MRIRRTANNDCTRTRFGRKFCNKRMFDLLSGLIWTDVFVLLSILFGFRGDSTERKWGRKHDAGDPRSHRKPYPCPSCGRSYTRKDTLRRHMRDECGKNPQYICYVCKKGFKQKSNFQRHSANVHGFKM
ncbi:uncharacterized protein LOC143149469 [Ptiloglossa arizonensis]|uniref:uncharacterized protein LOC143149469 n=1 Tax=Ptiloglossa arizonensis TaxID=3350558 RepID=UPI003F9F0E35